MIRESNGRVFIGVRVSVGKREFYLGRVECEERLKIGLKSRAVQGKANKELLAGLRKFFGAEVELVKGARSKDKVLVVRLPLRRVKELLGF